MLEAIGSIAFVLAISAIWALINRRRCMRCGRWADRDEMQRIGSGFITEGWICPKCYAEMLNEIIKIAQERMNQ